jgi:DNA-binding PadR family transcriptional regulator
MSVKLVILGLLLEKEMHPYEVQQAVNERQMTHYIKMANGSLYYAFEQLEKQGFVEVSSIEREANRPEKTIYRLTEAGKEEFQKQLLEQMAKKEQTHRPLYASLAFASYGEKEDIMLILKQRIDELNRFLQKMKQLYTVKHKEENRSKMYIMAGVIMHAETELRWLEGLYEDAASGNLQEIGDPLVTLLDCKRDEEEQNTSNLGEEEILYYVYNLNWRLPRDVQEEAAAVLMGISPDQAHMLLPTYGKECWENGTAILKEIGYPNNQKAFPRLASLLQDRNWPGALEAIEIFRNAGKDVSAPYIEKECEEAIRCRDSDWLEHLQFACDSLGMTEEDFQQKETYDQMKKLAEE